jgi:hypothetical protein
VYAYVQRLVSVVKMTMLQEYIAEQHSVVRFVWAKGSMKRIFIKKCLLFMVWKCLSCKAFLNWVEKFSQGLLKVADDAQPG